MRKFSVSVLVLFTICIFSFGAYTQETDSVSYFERQIGQLQKEMMDSLKNSPAYLEALEGISRNRGKSGNYTAFVLYSGVMHSNFKTFNQHIGQSGFPPLDAYSAIFGFGISNRNEMVIFDFYYFSGSATANSEKGREKIYASLMNFLQFDLGFNLLKNKKLALYPFIGLSYRYASITYNADTEIYQDFTDISQIIINDRSVNLHSSRLGWQGGLGFDIQLGTNKARTTNKVLFLKAGVNKPVWKDRFKYDDIRYDPDIKMGNWQIAIGIKFGRLE